ncbi:MAG: hypothetical protein RDV48_02450 [Candidatus Eremiobacteraeota bacterium]|nr:hypothetical protein [Candidatus Eremiobacteraeota bacterium]
MEIRDKSLQFEYPLGSGRQNEEQEEPVCDKFSFSEHDLSEEGKITLIIQVKENQSCGAMKEQCKKCGMGRLKEDLEIINGFTVEIDPRDLIEFVKKMPKEAEITVDHHEPFPLTGKQKNIFGI